METRLGQDVELADTISAPSHILPLATATEAQETEQDPSLESVEWFARLDAQGRFELLTAGPRLEEVVGGDLEELTRLRENFVFMVHPADRGRFEQVNATILEQPGPYERDYRLINARGQTRWLHEEGSGEKSADGAISIVCKVFDFSATREVEEALRRELATRDAAFDLLPVGLAYLGADGRIVRCNRTLRAWLEADGLFDISDERAWERILHREDGSSLAPSETPLARAMYGDCDREALYALGAPPLRWLSISTDPARDRRGEIVGAVMVCHDMTARRRVESDLRATNADLDRRVAERAAELERLHEKSQRQQSALAHISRLTTVAEMATGLAHEINQPLAAIANYVDASLAALREAHANGSRELVEWLEQARGQAVRAGEIIRRLRRFVRKSESTLSDVPPGELLHDVAALIRPHARSRGAEIRVETAPDAPNIRCDRLQIEQVLVNLLQNALDAVADQPVERRLIEARAERAPDSGLLLTVSDQGEGLQGRSPASLFEPFFSTKRDGLGMGLAISRTIVEEHGGKIRLTPGEKAGIRLEIVLPLVATTHQTEETHERQGDSPRCR